MESEFYSPGRRDFIKKLSMGSTFLLFALNFGGCEEIVEAINNRPTRRRINPANADSMAMIEIYKEAVALMKALPSSDGRNWFKQAAIHGTAAGGFTFCKHGTSHFVSWHRAYLFYLEKICQKLTGDTTFGLPYWNWAMDRKVPSPFWEAGSPLFLAGRSADSNDEALDSEVGHDTMEGILDETNFYLFASGTSAGGTASGALEGTPHNYIHNFVGGTMGQGNSPEDPIFWTHHCMVDYCWFDWNVNRGNSNPSDSAWLDTKWTHFVDGDGNPTEITALSTVLMPFLSYKYEETQIGTSAAKKVIDGKTEAELKEMQKRVEKGAEVRLTEKERIPLAQGAEFVAGRNLMLEVPAKLERLAPSLERGAEERILLNVGFARFPSDQSYFVRVFINMPDANADTPIKDAHFAGSLSFFGKNMDGEGHEGHAGHKPSYMVDITDTVRKLKQAGEIQSDQNLQFTLVTVPVTPRRQIAADTLTLENLDVIIGDATVALK